MVDQVPPIDQAVARLVDGDLPVVAAQVKHFAVLAHEHAGLFDAFDVGRFIQAIIRGVSEAAPVFALFDCCEPILDKAPQLISPACFTYTAVIPRPIGEGGVQHLVMSLFTVLAADAGYQCRAESFLIELALTARLFDLRMDVVADVITGQELDAIEEANAEGQADMLEEVLLPRWQSNGSEGSLLLPSFIIFVGERRLDQDTSNRGIERDRLRLEQTKFRSESRHSRIVLWVGTFVGVVAVIIPATSNYLNDSARLKLDAQRQEVELQQKADDLRLKQSEMERSRDATRVRFLRDHIDMIMSDEPDVELRLTALARLVMPDDADALIDQVHTIRRELASQRSGAHDTTTISMAQHGSTEEERSVPPLIVTPHAVSSSGYQQSTSGMAEGRAYAKKGDYRSALRSFNIAVTQDPNDPLSWNFKAYSEFRTKQFSAALASISRAWKLNPSENQTRRWLAINATKILCAQGRSSEAATFFNQSASVVPEIVTDVYGDGEFQSTCQAIWQG